MSILIFSEGISYCHIVRPLVIGRWLKTLGYPITVACTNASSARFAAEGFQTVSLHTQDPTHIYWRLSRTGLMYETEELLQYFKEDEALIRNLKPRLIVSDFRITALLLAKRDGIPSINITSASCHPNIAKTPQAFYHRVPDVFAKPRFMPLPVFDSLLHSSLGRMFHHYALAQLSRPFQQASRAYGVEVLPTLFDYLSHGDMCLLCDHPEVFPLGLLRPKDFYAGAVSWDRGDPLPEVLTKLDPNARTVYISLGTQESLGIAFLPRYLEALLKKGLQV